MADAHDKHDHGAHGHDDHEHHDNEHEHEHEHEAVEEDVVRTPMWMPFVGLGLLLSGALYIYLFLSPGVMAPANTDGGTAADASAAAAPAAVPVAPAEH